MKSKRLLATLGSICLALVLAALLLPACAAEEAPTPTPTPTPTPPAETVKWVWGEYESVMKGGTFDATSWFVEELSKRSNGRFQVEVHWGDLGSNKELLGLAESGVCDVSNTVTMFYPGKLGLSNVNFLPFAAVTRVDWDNRVSNELFDTNEALKQELASHNCVYGLHAGSAFYNLFSIDPIRTAEDFNGKRVRCSAEVGEVLDKFGAVPMTLSSAECYNALQTGLIDTYAHFRDSFWKRNIFEVSNYFIRELDMAACPRLYVVNKDSWEALPDDLKEVWISVRNDQGANSQYVYFGEEMKNAQEADFLKAGMEFIDFPAAERQKLVDAAESVWQDWAERNGGAPAMGVLDQYRKLGQEMVKQYPDGLPPYTP